MADAGADQYTFHLEATGQAVFLFPMYVCIYVVSGYSDIVCNMFTDDPVGLIHKIKGRGMKAREAIVANHNL